MPKRENEEEPTYLEKSKLKVKKGKTPKQTNRFYNEVCRAYYLEFKVKTDEHIAKLAGFSPSHFNQLVNSPEKLTIKMVEKILAPLRSEANIQRVVFRWCAERFGFKERIKRDEHQVGETVTDETISWIKFSVKSSHYSDSLRLVRSALDIATDQKHRYILYDLGVFSAVQADRPGLAMALAHDMYFEAKELRDFKLAATALYHRVTALNLTGMHSFDYCQQAIREALNLLEIAVDHPDAKYPYRVITKSDLLAQQLALQITWMERLNKPDDKRIQQILKEIDLLQKSNPKPGQDSAMRLLAIRCNVLLGNFFKAGDDLEVLFKECEEKNSAILHERASLIKLRIMAKTESFEATLQYAQGAIDQNLDHYNRNFFRLVDIEIAKLCEENIVKGL